MVVTVAFMRMMKASVHQIAGVVTVGDGLVPAIRAVDMIGFVSAAVREDLALLRIPAGHRDRVFLDFPVGARMVKVAVVEVVHVTVVANARVAASRSVLVGVRACVRVCHAASCAC
jgi:hypothetical protein